MRALQKGILAAVLIAVTMALGPVAAGAATGAPAAAPATGPRAMVTAIRTAARIPFWRARMAKGATAGRRITPQSWYIRPRPAPRPFAGAAPGAEGGAPRSLGHGDRHQFLVVAEGPRVELRVRLRGGQRRPAGLHQRDDRPPEEGHVQGIAVAGVQ